MPVRADATVSAEPVVAALGVELVVRQSVLASQERERVGLDGDAPGARLLAERAVAATRAGGEVELGAEADLTTVTATGIRLQAHERAPRVVRGESVAADIDSLMSGIA